MPAQRLAAPILALCLSTSSAALAAGSAASQTAPIFVSNDRLDKHVIFQDFAFFQPYESNQYARLTTQVDVMKKLGITDVWLAPPYRVLNNLFEEGYAVSDRYDLGEFPQGHGGAVATKYGTAADLRTLIAALHERHINAIADVVPNQMFLQSQEVTPVTAVDIFGNPNNPAVVDTLYPAYTKGGGTGQSTYGLIKQWNATLENGTSPQNLGLDTILVDASGAPYRYFGPDDPQNYLPAFLQGTAAAQAGALNTVDTYLLVTGYYAVSGIGDLFPNYKPYLLYYVDPRPGAANETYLDYMRANGFPGATDDAVRQAIITGDQNAVSNATNAYLGSQPGYSPASEAGIAAFRLDDKASYADIDDDVLQYEFLIGTDIDNSNPQVQAETLNWQQFLLTNYGFDGLRFDAAGHYNTAILTQSAAMMAQRYGSDIDNHLSIIESYVDQQAAFENGNRNGQLAYDADLYNSLSNTMEAKIASATLGSVFTGSINAAGRAGSGPDLPNWSFVNNHDQEHNTIALIPVPASLGDSPGSAQYQLDEMAIYDQDRAQPVKQYAQYNVPAAYALILTNKDTVPTVFYGDVFESDKSYGTVQTPYYDAIARLLLTRKLYVAGPQRTAVYVTNTSPTVAGQDLISSARLGTNRANGVAVVIGDDPATHAAITVDMGRQHARQWFVNVMGTGLESAFTDGKGLLPVTVSGTVTAQVHGYLGVWVPIP